MTKRICPVCGNPFEQRNKNHVFCNRRCFKIEYRKRINQESFPEFICPQCKTKTELDFHPMDSETAWVDFQCPICGYTPMNDSDVKLETTMETTISIIKKGLLD